MQVVEEMLSLKDENESSHLSRFFKTGKGEYGEGDKFLGIRVPKTRELVKKYYGKISLEQIPEILHNEYHEIRLFALLMLVKMYEKEPQNRVEIKNIYLDNVNYINNWDLVDLSAPKVIGRYCFETNDYSIVKELSISKYLWAERIAVVSQWYVIKKRVFNPTLKLCKKFLMHKHDLMHKACGWMLREVGKKDLKTLYTFLDKYHKIMPRTMLRYSLEKLSQEKKNFYM